MPYKVIFCYWKRKKTQKLDIPIRECHPVEIPDLPPQKLPGPTPVWLPPSLKGGGAKGVSTDAKKDIVALAHLVAHAAGIRNAGVQREFVAFAKKAIRHIELPEGVSLELEQD